MRLAPATLLVPPTAGTPFTIDVVIEGVSDLGAFEFEIEFDRDFVKVASIRAGPFLGSTGRTIACARLTVSFSVEKLGCNTEGSEPPGPSGMGVVAHIDFAVQGRAFGETSLRLRSCGAADVLGTSVLDDTCKDTKLTIGPPTPTPEGQRMIKEPPLQNVFLTRQGAKIPPQACAAGSNVATLTEQLTIPITDPDGPGKIGEALGAFEFELRFDEKNVCVNLSPGPVWADLVAAGDALCTIQDKDSSALEGLARIGCVTYGKSLGIDPLAPLALIEVRPEPELYSLLRANQDNGIAVQILNQGCELSEDQGHPLPLTSCEDADVTFRYLEGDVHGPDCDVDLLDTQQVAFRWGAQLGSLLYMPFLDLEPSGQVQGDGDIDTKDLQFVFGRIDSTCDDPHPPQPPVNPKGGGTPAATATPTITPTPPPTPTPDGKPRVNLSPGQQALTLADAPAPLTCAEGSDIATFDVVVKDPILSPDPKTPSQLQVLGAFEFEIFYDSSIICLEITPGEIPLGEMTCLVQQNAASLRYACATQNSANPPTPQPPGVLATIAVRPHPDVYALLPPGSGLQLTAALDLDFCDLADLLGHDIKTSTCSDAALVLRAP
jgi:hypothetical protein